MSSNAPASNRETDRESMNINKLNTNTPEGRVEDGKVVAHACPVNLFETRQGRPTGVFSIWGAR